MDNSKQNLPTKADAPWQDDSRLKKVAVVVRTPNCILDGYTYCLKQQRLLDALNNGFTTKEIRVGTDFLPLAEVKASFPDKNTETLSFSYIRKTNILFIGERDTGKTADEPSIYKPKVYPMRKKKAIAAKVHMPPYTLTGSMYSEAWEQLVDALNREDMFLPLTDAEVSPVLDSGEKVFSFMAVNKDRIEYVGSV